jgi:hypothetical protein
MRKFITALAILASFTASSTVFAAGQQCSTVASQQIKTLPSDPVAPAPGTQPASAGNANDKK